MPTREHKFTLATASSTGSDALKLKLVVHSRSQASCDSDTDSGLTGKAHWQDIDEEDDCPDSVCGEPGEKYWKIL